MYESNREDLTNGSGRTALDDVFPSLQKYKDEHNADNLQKLCVEISGFCRSVYASTRCEEERSVYQAMIKKLNK